jgi:hypothetical protein
MWDRIINSIKKLFNIKINYKESENNINLINKGFEEILNFIPNSVPKKSNSLGRFYSDKSLSDFISQKSQEGH